VVLARYTTWRRRPRTRQKHNVGAASALAQSAGFSPGDLPNETSSS
jgi:hypothetical protein